MADSLATWRVIRIGPAEVSKAESTKMPLHDDCDNASETYEISDGSWRHPR
jgi:hypothetical protein